MAFADNLYAFGNRGGLLSRIEQNRGVQVANDLNQYRLGAAQREEQKLNTLGELYSKARAGDTAAVDAMARLDPKFAMGVETHQAGLQKERRAQQTQQQEQVARQAIWANSPEKWQSTPFAQQGIPFEQRDAVIGQFIGNEGAFKNYQDANRSPYQNVSVDDAGNPFGFNTQTGTYDRLPGATQFQNPPSGMAVEVGPDGTMSFRQGSGVGMGGASADYTKKYDQASATADVDLDTSITGGIDQTQQGRYTVARLQALLNEGTKTGAAEPAKYAVAKWLQSAGVEVDITNQEELNRLSRKLAFDELAKFKGATSEKELAFALNLVGNLGSDPQALRRYLLVTDLVLQRNEQIAALRNQYVNENGNVKGFRYHMDQWKLNNPLIAQPKGDDDFASLPVGAVYVDPDDGKLYLKK